MTVESALINEIDNDTIFTLEKEDCCAILATKGPILHEFYVKDRNGNFINVMAGPSDIAEYYGNGFEPGQLFIAPWAGRVRNTDNSIVLHSGGQDSDTRLPEIPTSVRIAENNSVVMEWEEAGVEGGRYNATLTYGLLKDGYFIETTVTPTDNDIYWNPTTHAYYNLGGPGSNPDDQLLTVPATNVLETDEKMIPTGEIVSITKDDVLNESRTGELGLDHYYVLKDSGWNGLVTKAEFVNTPDFQERFRRV